MKLKSPKKIIALCALVLTTSLCNFDNAVSSPRQVDGASAHEGIMLFSDNYFNGKITYIDEDNFLIMSKMSGVDGAANFNYEVISVKDDISDKTIKLLFPHPTAYREGESISGTYKYRSNITFESIIDKYTSDYFDSRDFFVQKGKIYIDGLVNQ